jgi:hypothetical protein
MFGPPPEVPLAEPETGRIAASQSAGEDSKGIPTREGGFAAAAAARLRASGPLGWAVFALGVVGAILLVVAELTNLRYTTVITATCRDLAGPKGDKCSVTGGQQHHYALLPLALLMLVMSWGVAVGRARAAAVALIAIGAVVLVIAIAFDLPDTRKVGALSEDFTGGKEHAGAAIKLEIAGAALGIAGGLLGLRRRYGEPEPDDG